MSIVLGAFALFVGLMIYLCGVGICGELDGHNDVSARVYGWSRGRRRAERIFAWLYPAPLLAGFVWLAGAVWGIW